MNNSISSDQKLQVREVCKALAKRLGTNYDINDFDVRPVSDRAAYTCEIFHKNLVSLRFEDKEVQLVVEKINGTWMAGLVVTKYDWMRPTITDTRRFSKQSLAFNSFTDLKFAVEGASFGFSEILNNFKTFCDKRKAVMEHTISATDLITKIQ